METETLQPESAVEQALIKTIKTLNIHQALQVLDFARWLQTRPIFDPVVGEEISEADLELEEKVWEQTYLANRDSFRAMAQEALSDLEAGNTLEMVVEDGKIVCR